MESFNLEIITPSKSRFDGKIKSVTIPGSMGQFQVLYNHAPLVSSFEVGIIRFENENGEEKRFSTSGGTVEVLNNNVLVLAETLEAPEEIDAQRAEAAMERARKRLQVKYKPDVDSERAELALKRSINRLKLIK